MASEAWNKFIGKLFEPEKNIVRSALSGLKTQMAIIKNAFVIKKIKIGIKIKRKETDVNLKRTKLEVAKAPYNSVLGIFTPTRVSDSSYEQDPQTGQGEPVEEIEDNKKSMKKLWEKPERNLDRAEKELNGLLLEKSEIDNEVNKATEQEESIDDQLETLE